MDKKENSKIDVKTYINQFNIIDNEEADLLYCEKFNTKDTKLLHCENLSKLLYSAILNKFRITISEDDYQYFKEYQERMFDLVENLRELTSATIPMVFDYLTEINPYLPDIIIMLWCLPRTDQYLSKKIYNNKYKQNIQKYNIKIIKNIENGVIKNFCIETLTKTNSVPVHCIDYLWLYMNGLSFDFSFYNQEGAQYIGFEIPESDENNKNKDEDETFINFGFNMEYMLEMGLGQVVYRSDPLAKGSFRNFLKNIIFDANVVKNLLSSQSTNNLKTQLRNIIRNPKKYFGDTATQIPEEISQLVNL